MSREGDAPLRSLMDAERAARQALLSARFALDDLGAALEQARQARAGLDAVHDAPHSNTAEAPADGRVRQVFVEGPNGRPIATAAHVAGGRS